MKYISKNVSHVSADSRGKSGKAFRRISTKKRNRYRASLQPRL